MWEDGEISAASHHCTPLLQRAPPFRLIFEFPRKPIPPDSENVNSTSYEESPANPFRQPLRGDTGSRECLPMEKPDKKCDEDDPASVLQELRHFLSPKFPPRVPCPLWNFESENGGRRGRKCQVLVVYAFDQTPIHDRRRLPVELIAIIPHSARGTAVDPFHDRVHLFLSFWLFVNVGLAKPIVPSNVQGCCFPAKITIRALVINVKFARDVQGIAMCKFCHRGPIIGGIGRFRHHFGIWASEIEL